MDENNNNQNNNQSDADEIFNDINNSLFQVVETEKPLEADDEKRAVSLNEIRQKSNKRKKKRKKKWIAVLCWILAIVIVAASASTFAVMAFTDISGISFDEKKEYEITIPQGASTEQIADILHNAGAISHPFIFRLYSKLKGEDGKYQYGYYTVSSSSGYEGIISKLQTVGATAEEKTVTIPEGTGITEIIKIFSKSGLCTKDEFKDAMTKGTYNFDFVKDIPKESVYYLLEGYLYPDTYKFAYVKDDGVNNAKRAINKMLSTMQSKVFTDDNIAAAKKLNYSMHEILTMASIIQLEAGGSPDNMSSVAQVFYNRLNWDDAKLLGSTPTSNYVSSRYDTNKYEGLPPGPLDSPSLNAIEAALHPKTSIKATYFVTDKNGKFYYTSSLSEHNAIISSLKNQGIWEY